VEPVSVRLDATRFIGDYPARIFWGAMKPEHLLGLWVLAGSMITLISAMVGALVVLPPARWRTFHWTEQARI
jgi:hypothetical protein